VVAVEQNRRGTVGGGRVSEYGERAVGGFDRLDALDSRLGEGIPYPVRCTDAFLHRELARIRDGTERDEPREIVARSRHRFPDPLADALRRVGVCRCHDPSSARRMSTSIPSSNRSRPKRKSCSCHTASSSASLPSGSNAPPSTAASTEGYFSGSRMRRSIAGVSDGSSAPSLPSSHEKRARPVAERESMVTTGTSAGRAGGEA